MFPMDCQTPTLLLISTGLEQWTKSKEATFIERQSCALIQNEHLGKCTNSQDLVVLVNSKLKRNPWCETPPEKNAF